METSLLFCLRNSLNFMYARFMLQNTVYSFTLDDTVSILASFSNGHVFLYLLFFEVITHTSAVVSIHVEDLFGEQTTLTSTSSLHNFQSTTVSLICFRNWQYLIYDFILELLECAIVFFITLKSYEILLEHTNKILISISFI